MVCTALQYVYGIWYNGMYTTLISKSWFFTALQYLGQRLYSTAISDFWFVQHCNIWVMVHTAH
jgi:hypothetical protein